MSKDVEFDQRYGALGKLLERCEQVSRFDTADEKEAWTLAHALLDLAESFRRYLEDQLPRLSAGGLSCEQIEDVLGEIGEELRHVHYHIHDARFFGYLHKEESERRP